MDFELKCTDEFDGDVCGGDLYMEYNVSTGYNLYLVDGAEPDNMEDSSYIESVLFRCEECGEEITLTKEQLHDFIKWGDEHLSSRLWARMLKPYLEDKYETKD